MGIGVWKGGGWIGDCREGIGDGGGSGEEMRLERGFFRVDLGDRE